MHFQQLVQDSKYNQAIVDGPVDLSLGCDHNGVEIQAIFEQLEFVNYTDPHWPLKSVQQI